LVDKLYQDDLDHLLSSADDHTSDEKTDSASKVSSLEKHIKKKS
jgi:hypothetical protein